MNPWSSLLTATGRNNPRKSEGRPSKSSPLVRKSLTYLECEKIIGAEKERLRKFYETKMEQEGIKMKM